MIWGLEIFPPQPWALEIAKEFAFRQSDHQYNPGPNLTVLKVMEIGALLDKVKQWETKMI